jgi:LacI family transcriptional regulator
MASRVRIQDIAGEAGVAVPTAYQAMAGTGRLRDATRRRVLEAADRLGYRVNRTASVMRQGRHGAIGLLVQQWQRLPRNSFEVFLDVARQRDVFLLAERVDGDRALPRTLTNDCVDGLIVFEPLDEPVAEQIRHLSMPVVQVNTNLRGEPGCIAYDERGAMERLVDRFARQGRTRPALMMPGPAGSSHYSATDRLGALSELASSAGLGDPVVVSAEYFWETPVADSAAIRLLRDQPEIDAIVLYDDYLAPPLFNAALMLGRRIGKDLSVIGFNDSGYARAVHPELTSLKVDQRAIGELAFDLLDRHARTGRMPPARTLPYTLIERDSG